LSLFNSHALQAPVPGGAADDDASESRGATFDRLRAGDRRSADSGVQAATFRQARELGKEDWLQEDLKRMTIGHRPPWDGMSPIRVRRAEPAEEVYYVDAKTENAVGDLPLVYLVQRDDEMDTAGPLTRGSFPPRR